jgi:hypothetical protein
MSSFGEYVDGKTIAVVGPAPAPYDQSAEVDAHDIVWRASYGVCAPTDDQIVYSSSTDDGRNWYRSKVFPAGYGTRVDISYYNTSTTWQAMRGELDQVLVDLDWAVFKAPGMPPSGLTRVRTANAPPMKVPGTQNVITAILWDLTHYRPASVTVYGADFYTGPIEEWYDPNYMATEVMTDPRQMETATRAAHWHDQGDNRRIVKIVRDLGWLVGDERYLRALDMTFDEYNRILEAQLTRAHQATMV